MPSDNNPGQRINLFSLVQYLPEPLGSFVDRLRQELVPACNLRAHVTILPPRPLAATPEAAWAHIRSILRECEPFELRLEDIEIFTLSSVVYLALDKRGREQMQRLHGALNTGAAYFNEPFPFHPHVTLAQQITAEQVPAVFEFARYRWASFVHASRFPIDRATFVQSTIYNTWIDLDEDFLGQGMSP
jgi:2'-5' RNA ligase